MSDTSLAFRAAAAPLFHGEKHTEKMSAPFLYVYAPEQYVPHVADVLKRNGIPHAINCYGILDYSSKTLCSYRRTELSPLQRDVLADAAASGGRVEALLEHLEQRLHCVEAELLPSDYPIEHHLPQQAQWPKRLLDIVLSLGLLVLTLPLWLLTAIAIKLESPGPVFFRQCRTGLLNREFEIIKFRSMYQDAEKDGARWAALNDERVTRTGYFIRRMRIDELPQLLNVLKGDMSLIGPRPEREVFIHELEQQIPFYRFRHRVKPGITGLAQVRYTYGASVEDALHKHRHDLYYIKHQNFWMDMAILWRTVRIVLTGQGV